MLRSGAGWRAAAGGREEKFRQDVVAQLCRLNFGGKLLLTLSFGFLIAALAAGNLGYSEGGGS
jgi:hypothetical protein